VGTKLYWDADIAETPDSVGHKPRHIMRSD